MRVYLLAHGSADPRHAADVERIGRRLGRATGAQVRTCYLDHCAPALADVADAPGVVVPLLFSPGYHVQVDVGLAMAQAQQDGIALRLADPPLLTSAAGWAGDLLAEVGERWPGRGIVLVSAGTRDETVLAQWEETARAFGAPVVHASGPGARLADLPDPTGAVVVPLLVARGTFSDRIAAQAAAMGLPTTPVAGASQAMARRLALALRADPAQPASRAPGQPAPV